ncbi:leucine-rich repeat domain-containing protein [Persicobacter diffluens]|uniref:Disease resistance R13L4/SHOC-2-like LRR domain-containing protein n=1 Tax=Persicobacter diffluens TaxID=981 RepID=A0AAN4VYL6_9BACT|nr:hypothetical protein PEDI_17520 [Persicobacter diffluens]
MQELHPKIYAHIEKARKENWTELDLSNLGLEDIPQEVFEITSLEVLKVMNNKIRGIPERIRKLENLRHLYLYNNRITDVSPELLIEMPYLECFDLADNPMDYQSAVDFFWEHNRWKGYRECLAAVRDLQAQQVRKRFSWNKPLRMIPMELFQIEELEALTIHGFELKALSPGIGNLKCLKKLDLSANQLNALPQEILELSSLNQIILDQNQFREFPEYLLQMTQLEEISLNENQLKALPKEVFSLPALKKLYASKNPFEGFNADDIGGDYFSLERAFNREW